ncbi:MAG TPA: SIR2 family protein [Burkholderiales bacterium]|nr:SIR2 family protein [Burkholderiales bacterium]
MSTTTFLTPTILDTIANGNAVLFLGAGASRGAIGESGETSPTGDQLRDLLCEKFLGGSLKNKPLAQVAEICKNEAGLLKVQECIRQIFFPLQPVHFHRLVSDFRWFSIVTTNYDLILERAYDQNAARQQTLSPILHDGDNFSERLRDPAQVVYLKLHGCITQVTDPNLPLILASEEYAKYRRGRERLFRHFQDWAREHPVIFCGYDIGDPNLQQILFDLADLGIRRPYFAFIKPHIDEFTSRYWTSKRFAVSDMTFEAFLSELNGTIPSASRSLSPLISRDRPSWGAWIKSHTVPTTPLLLYLEKELIHISKGMSISGVDPRKFYEGRALEWGAIQQDLDVRRRISDDAILDAFLDKSKTKFAQAYVVKGYAGSGKAVTLRRIAWDIAHLYDGLVFFLTEGSLLRQTFIGELYELVAERIYIVIENIIPHIRDVVQLLSWANKRKVEISLIFGARTNEWNVFAGELDSTIDNDYELRDLTEREIRQLIEKLAKHGALGRLNREGDTERLDHFRLTSERQLLVALHDLGSEKPFEEIIFDEYRNIQPPEARLLYLDVCTLHRLGVGVRAGLISRISGITFEYFEKEFFSPLEHVVRTYFDHASRDNMYRSRHPFIADMVFKQALANSEERSSQIVRLIKNMDVDYVSDSSAFHQLIRGTVLADLFAIKALAFQIFDAAMESGAPASYIEHQRAVFELHHPSGSIADALLAINRAESLLAYTDRSITHTKAAILRKYALQSPPLARQKYREEAKKLLMRQLNWPHSFHTLGQIILDELREKLGSNAEVAGPSEDYQERSISELIRQMEEVIQNGFQRFPDDQFLLTLESDFAKLLEDKPRSVHALRSAFEQSPGRSFVAIRLAAYERRAKDDQAAIDILKRSLSVNPSSKEVHLAFAKILISQNEYEYRDEIVHHLKRSFTSGDSNLDAQFWYARHQFLYGDRQIGLTSFAQLSGASIPPEYKRRHGTGVVLNVDGSKKKFSGSIKTLENSYCFIACPDLRWDIYSHASSFRDSDWGTFSIGDQMIFEVAFIFRGPIAINVRAK